MEYALGYSIIFFIAYLFFCLSVQNLELRQPGGHKALLFGIGYLEFGIFLYHQGSVTPCKIQGFDHGVSFST